jgi:hypothetical protein
MYASLSPPFQSKGPKEQRQAISHSLTVCFASLKRFPKKTSWPARTVLCWQKNFRGHYQIVKDRTKIPGCVLPSGSAFQGPCILGIVRLLSTRLAKIFQPACVQPNIAPNFANGGQYSDRRKNQFPRTVAQTAPPKDSLWRCQRGSFSAAPPTCQGADSSSQNWLLRAANHAAHNSRYGPPRSRSRRTLAPSSPTRSVVRAIPTPSAMRHREDGSLFGISGPGQERIGQRAQP